MTSRPELARLAARADRLDELAEMASLMDDDTTAAALHAEAVRCREHTMTHLDGHHTSDP